MTRLSRGHSGSIESLNSKRETSCAINCLISELPPNTLMREFAQRPSGAWGSVERRIQSSSYGLHFPGVFHSVFTRGLWRLLFHSQDYPYALASNPDRRRSRSHSPGPALLTFFPAGMG